MLYLAEVQKKTRVIGSGKVELKLLACQRSEQHWSAVPGEEIIPAPDDANYNAGVLVMVELTASKQVQRHAEAGRQLISILQNFSRLQEKSKTQEEEIEQWKESLTYQSQELNRREMEMEARQEQLQQMEEDFKHLEQQRQEIESAQGEVSQLREEFERKQAELEGAWAHLRGEMNRMEERRAEMQEATVLGDEQASYIQDLLSRFSGAVAPVEFVREQLNASFGTIGQYQGQLDHHWQDLEQQRQSAQQLQEGVEQQGQVIQQRWQAWQEAQEALEQVRAELKAKQETLSLKQEQAQLLAQQLKDYENLHQQVYNLANGSEGFRVGTKIDVEALDRMPLDELQTLVNDLTQDLEKMSRFVASQEEELTLQQDAINDLKNQIQQASEYDRLRLEAEVTDEQDRYQMLNETLVGQRRNLQEREAVLRQHQAVLARRQGHALNDCVNNEIDLDPLLAQINEMRQHYGQELQKLEADLQQLQEAIAQIQAESDQKTAGQEAARNELKQLEQDLQAQRSTVAEHWGKVNLYQETLQPTQDTLNELKQKAEAIAGVMTQFQEANDYQLQAVTEMQQFIQQLTNPQAAELAAS